MSLVRANVYEEPADYLTGVDNGKCYFIDFRDSKTKEMKSVAFKRRDFDVNHDKAYLVRFDGVWISFYHNDAHSPKLDSDFGLLIVSDDGDRKVAVLENNTHLITNVDTDFEIRDFFDDEIDKDDERDPEHLGTWVWEYDQDDNPIPIKFDIV